MQPNPGLTAKTLYPVFDKPAAPAGLCPGDIRVRHYRARCSCRSRAVAKGSVSSTEAGLASSGRPTYPAVGVTPPGPHCGGLWVFNQAYVLARGLSVITTGWTAGYHVCSSHRLVGPNLTEHGLDQLGAAVENAEGTHTPSPPRAPPGAEGGAGRPGQCHARQDLHRAGAAQDHRMGSGLVLVAEGLGRGRRSRLRRNRS